MYVPADKRTPPNEHLAHVEERDIVTPSGKKLTLMNPAYMLRQMMNEYAELYGVEGRITSLRPFEISNEPDSWEKGALIAFEKGTKEVFKFTDINGEPYLRLIHPMYTKEECLKCHGFQGYQVGDVRGGVGVSVPMEPYLSLERHAFKRLVMSHALIWLLGMLGIIYGFRKINVHLLARKRSEEEKAILIDDLQEALKDVKALQGLLPICSHCKSIRDDQGYWSKLEAYMSEHSEIRFSHGICPECARKFYPEVFDDKQRD